TGAEGLKNIPSPSYCRRNRCCTEPLPRYRRQREHTDDQADLTSAATHDRAGPFTRVESTLAARHRSERSLARHPGLAERGLLIGRGRQVPGARRRRAHLGVDVDIEQE